MHIVPQGPQKLCEVQKAHAEKVEELSAEYSCKSSSALADLAARHEQEVEAVAVRTQKKEHIVMEMNESYAREMKSVRRKLLESEDGLVSDGMDLALCVWNKKTNELKFSGANQPFYLIRNGELNITKPNKQPIGYFEDKMHFPERLFLTVFD